MVDAILDTSILIDLLRNFPPALIWKAEQKDVQFGITTVVWMEVIEGAPNKIKQNIAIRFLNQFESVYLTREDQVWAMDQLKIYHPSHNVGRQDCLIAAPCHRLGLPLYTRNLKHFIPLLGDQVKEPYTLET